MRMELAGSSWNIIITHIHSHASWAFIPITAKQTAVSNVRLTQIITAVTKQSRDIESANGNEEVNTNRMDHSFKQILQKGTVPLCNAQMIKRPEIFVFLICGVLPFMSEYQKYNVLETDSTIVTLCKEDTKTKIINKEHILVQILHLGRHAPLKISWSSAPPTLPFLFDGHAHLVQSLSLFLPVFSAVHGP